MLAEHALTKKAAAEQALAEALAAEQAVFEFTEVSAGEQDGPGIALKLLFAPLEAACLMGDGEDGSNLDMLQSTSGTNMRLSDSHYPGSSLHELTIMGLTAEAVLWAIVQIMVVIEEGMGLVSAGESGIEPGGCRIKLVLPSRAAAGVIGVGGAQVKEIRQQYGVRTIVDMNTVPCGAGLFEQAVLMCGTSANVQRALPIILDQVAQMAAEKDLESTVVNWATHSNAGVHIPGFSLFAPKGKGKGKGCKG